MAKQTITSLAVLAIAVAIGGGIVLFDRSPSLPQGALHQALEATYTGIPTDAGKANFQKQSKNLTVAVDPTLADLDSQIITCSPNVDSLMSDKPATGAACVGGSTTLASTTGLYLSGQCCSTMTDLDNYNRELTNLQTYKSLSDVPLNPFKVPVATAKKWIDYDNGTTLSEQDQATFDQAMAMSKEKPCCCKCWHYFMNEGIGKSMIKDDHYTAKQVAYYWDNSDICGA